MVSKAKHKLRARPGVATTVHNPSRHRDDPAGTHGSETLATTDLRVEDIHQLPLLLAEEKFAL